MSHEKIVASIARKRAELDHFDGHKPLACWTGTTTPNEKQAYDNAYYTRFSELESNQ